MSIELKYLKKEDLKKLDNFIIKSLNKFFFVKEPWEKLKEVTKKDYNDIISKKPTIPDLIIYNKTFNKCDCFINSKKNIYIKFPRIQFLLRPKKYEGYDPSCTYSDNKNSFIPEDKKFDFEEEDNKTNIGKKKSINNIIKNGKDIMNNINNKNNMNSENKIKNEEKENIKFEKLNNKFKYNDFLIKNISIYFDNYFQNYIYNELLRSKNNNINFNNNNENQIIEFEKGKNFDNLYYISINERNWQVKDKNTNGIIYKFNNEQLYYYLNEILNRKEKDIFFYINHSVYDIYYEPLLIYNELKNRLFKNN